MSTFLGAPLTAEEIHEMDEIASDIRGADDMLKVALNYHANRISTINKLEKAWWERALGARGIDRDGPVYTLKRKGSFSGIVKDGEDES